MGGHVGLVEQLNLIFVLVDLVVSLIYFILELVFESLDFCFEFLSQSLDSLFVLVLALKYKSSEVDFRLRLLVNVSLKLQDDRTYGFDELV